MKRISTGLTALLFFLPACTSRTSPETTTFRTGTEGTRDSSQTNPAGPAISADPDADAVSSATAVANRATFNGVIVLSPHKRASVTLSMGGTVKNTTLLPGTCVPKGALLATLENPAFIDLQQTYLDSRAQTEFLQTEYKRQQALAAEEAASQKRLQQSKADYLSMKSRMEAEAARLRLLGVDTAGLAEGGIVPYLEVKAPIGGYVSETEMNVGKHFEAGVPLCEIVDKSEPLLRLTAYEKDLPRVKTGDAVRFRVNGMGDLTFRATIISVGQQVDAANRSIDVYARVSGENPEFRPGMYVSARIEPK